MRNSLRKLIMIVIMVLVLLSGMFGWPTRTMPMMHYGTHNSNTLVYMCPPPPIAC